MNKLEEMVKNVEKNIKDSDYPMCYTKQSQVLTFHNKVVYSGPSLWIARRLSTELNRRHYNKRIQS